MDWIDILQKKKQTFLWSDKIPEREIIDTILDEVHTHCPSKQNNVPYNIEVLDWADKERRHKIFEDTWCDEDDITDRRNPQVLAPYLFVFTARGINLSPDENSYAQLEIGLVAMFIALSATNYGLNYGFCACNNNEIVLTLGVGYPNPDYVSPAKGHFFNPLLQKRVWLTSSDEPKPDKSQYIQFD